MNENENSNQENDWHEKMVKAGWHPVRDLFGEIAYYGHYSGLVLERSDFEEWQRADETPPLF